MVALRRANIQPRAESGAAYSDTSAPHARIRGTSGRRRPRTVATNVGIDSPRTAIVLPPVSSAPRCAALSIPCASPDTTTMPARAQDIAISRATRSP